jgi:hypothetical protein
MPACPTCCQAACTYAPCHSRDEVRPLAPTNSYNVVLDQLHHSSSHHVGVHGAMNEGTTLITQPAQTLHTTTGSAPPCQPATYNL